MSKPPDWHGDLTMNDWLLDGEPIRRDDQKLKWSKLDWSKSYIDMGPSPAGNYGPYWHVPWNFQGEKLWARLYPKLIQTKWFPLVQHALSRAYALEQAARWLEAQTENQGVLMVAAALRQGADADLLTSRPPMEPADLIDATEAIIKAAIRGAPSNGR